jgi:hypothetical protein
LGKFRQLAFNVTVFAFYGHYKIVDFYKFIKVGVYKKSGEKVP